MPGVSDPGARAVAAAIDARARASRSMPGPSRGARRARRRRACRPIGSRSSASRRARPGARQELFGTLRDEVATLIFYEAPDRVGATLADLAAALGADRRASLGRELTKLHEEHVRGTLGELAARYAEIAPRGECTLVVEGGAAATRRTIDIEAELRRLLAEGLGPKDAAARLVVVTGKPRRQLYQLALSLQRAREPMTVTDADPVRRTSLPHLAVAPAHAAVRARGDRPPRSRACRRSASASGTASAAPTSAPIAPASRTCSSTCSRTRPSGSAAHHYDVLRARRRDRGERVDQRRSHRVPRGRARRISSRSRCGSRAIAWATSRRDFDVERLVDAAGGRARRAPPALRGRAVRRRAVRGRPRAVSRGPPAAPPDDRPPRRHPGRDRRRRARVLSHLVRARERDARDRRRRRPTTSTRSSIATSAASRARRVRRARARRAAAGARCATRVADPFAALAPHPPRVARPARARRRRARARHPDRRVVRGRHRRAVAPPRLRDPARAARLGVDDQRPARRRGPRRGRSAHRRRSRRGPRDPRRGVRARRRRARDRARGHAPRGGHDLVADRADAPRPACSSAACCTPTTPTCSRASSRAIAPSRPPRSRRRSRAGSGATR